MKVKTEQEGKLLDMLIDLYSAYKNRGENWATDCGYHSYADFEREPSDLETEVEMLLYSYKCK